MQRLSRAALLELARGPFGEPEVRVALQLPSKVFEVIKVRYRIFLQGLTRSTSFNVD